MSNINSEVGTNILSLVKVISYGKSLMPRFPSSPAVEFGTMAEIAFQLAAAKDDWEAPARAKGWKTADMTQGMLVRAIPGQPLADQAMSWRLACEFDKIGPAAKEVEAVYVVTPELAKDLQIIGEYVENDFGGLHVWSVTATNIEPILTAVVSYRAVMAATREAGV